jgi:hypothetical protein
MDDAYYVSADDPIEDYYVTGSYVGEGGALVLPLFGDDNPAFLFVEDPPVFELQGGAPSHAAEWDWDSATGKFSYTPDADFSGVDEFSFTIKSYTKGDYDGNTVEWSDFTSNTATVRLLVGSGVTVALSPEDPPTDDPPPPCDQCSSPSEPQASSAPASGNSRVMASLGNGQSASYRDAPDATLLRADYTADSDFHESLSSVDYKVYFEGDEEPSYFGTVDGTAVPVGEQGSFFIGIRSPKGQSGYFKLSSKPQSSGGLNNSVVWMPILDQDNFGFGAGWNLAGIERIVAPPADLPGSNFFTKFWIRSDGYVMKFTDFGEPIPGDVDATVIERYGSGYLVTDKHGTSTLFDDDGWIDTRSDRYGNLTIYNYADINDDGDEHEITSVYTTVDGHSTTYIYGSGQENSDRPLVSTIVYFSGRET